MATRKPPTSSPSRSNGPARTGRGTAKPAARSSRRSTPEAADDAGSNGGTSEGKGRNLVIVESPAKAKTINKYLGSEYRVLASVGHVRDLPERAPKGSKQPVPGVDLANRFEPTYEVMAAKKKTVTELKRAAKQADQIWFATDLDREGEAIAWHLAQELGIPADQAKRVIFNAITRSEILRAFEHPHAIDIYKVNAQQARRILDRIVGYQVSPLLWKKVARGLSAGRVQSVAVRLIVEREREIDAFVPEEFWRVPVRLTPKIAEASTLAKAWEAFLATRNERDAALTPRAPTQKAQSAWIAERGAIEAELVELDGARFDLRRGGATATPVARVPTDGDSDDVSDGVTNGVTTPVAGAAPQLTERELDARIEAVANAVGLLEPRLDITLDPEAKGPAQRRVAISGRLDPATRYRVVGVETRRTATRPPGPFITSSLQVAASTYLGFGADRTMRLAQKLYEGVELKGQGAVGLITYMRTDSTHISGEALREARDFIGGSFGAKYLPEKPNFFGSSNKSAQEAHEAIRPTEASRTPDSLRGMLADDELKLYRLIWGRFVACQMTPAEWDATTVRFERSDRATGAVLRAGGRVLVFDGWYRAAGMPASADDPTLPKVAEGDVSAPFSIEPQQRFTQPPPRYSEASLVKKLEEEGIGRPSTYAAIIRVIQDRGYVEQLERRFRATDLGVVVTDKLIEGFPQLMDVGYTREMEGELDKIEENHTDWKEMLERFYGPFSDALGHALENMSHAKSEIEPAPYACPKCGRPTAYRFGKNGRFLSCSGYPDCDYAAPIDREGRPMLPEEVDLLCPEDGSAMVLRTGRFGPFIASVNYPQIRFVINVDRKGNIKLPSPPPLVIEELRCEKCQKPMNLRPGKRGPWLGCSGFPKCRGRMAWTKLDDATRARLEAALATHEKEHPQVVLRRRKFGPVPLFQYTPRSMSHGERASAAAVPSPGGAIGLRLSVMMFLQFFIWGSWYVTTNNYMNAHGLGSVIAWAYTVGPIAAIVSPFFLGMVADRFFASERVLGALQILGGVIIMFAPTMANYQWGWAPETGAMSFLREGPFLGILLLHMLCYMPTLGLTNTVAFHAMHTPEKQFPLVRVWGTIGWIVAGLTVSWLAIDRSDVATIGTSTFNFGQYHLAGAAAIVLGVYSFSLPHTPPPLRGKAFRVRDALGLDALSMLRKRSFAVFILCSFLLCIPLAAYYAFANGFVESRGVSAVGAAMSRGQMSEIFFMLIMPACFALLGVKWMLAVGMLAWVVRYLLFAWGAEMPTGESGALMAFLTGDAAMLLPIFIGILLHGICYDFFFVTGFIYVDREAPKAIRASAQGFLVLVTQGLGMLIGAQVAGRLYGSVVAVEPPAESSWATFWLIPAGFALAVLIFFLLFFRDPARRNATRHGALTGTA